MLAGCGPIEYINQVSVRAANAVAAAKAVGGDRYAPYEFTAAEAYLHKAREEAGYAEYQDSIEYGRKAEELAERAKAIALTRMDQPGLRGSPPKKRSPADETDSGASADKAADPSAAKPEEGDGKDEGKAGKGDADPAPPADKPRRKRPETGPESE